jgi:hypothetical protein
MEEIRENIGEENKEKLALIGLLCLGEFSA